MKINVTQKLLGLNNEEMRVVLQACPVCGRPVEEEENQTLRNAATSALTALFRDEPNLDAKKKFERGALALRIHNNDEPSLSVNEVALVKELIGKRFDPLIIVRAWAILDPTGE